MSISNSGFCFLIMSRPAGSNFNYQFSRTDGGHCHNSEANAMEKATYLAREYPEKEFAIARILTVVKYQKPVVPSDIEIKHFD